MKKIIVLTTAYNCSPWIEKCITSIKQQSYSNFHCFILDDLSTDNTVELGEKAIQNDPRFTIIKNKKKMYQPGNYDQIIRNTFLVDDDNIIVEVDGDDYLPDDSVFNRVILYYTNPNTWLTYGQFKYTTGQLGFAGSIDFTNIRKSRFTATHLRTWKAKLWRLINQEDLLVNGEYPQCAGDIFFMLPMIEMCGPEHALFVSDINYVYNFENPIGDSKGERLLLTQKFADIGRSKKSYKRIEKL